MRASRRTAVTLVIAAIAFAASDVSAHRLDECLQAARIDVGPTDVELDLTLTPGVAIVEKLLADIDRDGNQSLSRGEQDSFVESLRAVLELAVDGQSVRLHAEDASFADVAALRRGEGAIQLRFRAAHAPLAVGAHQVFFRNTYRRELSVYLANALVPTSSAVAVTAQRRETEQRELTIDYVVRAGAARTTSVWVFAAASAIGLALLLVPPMYPRIRSLASG